MTDNRERGRKTDSRVDMGKISKIDAEQSNVNRIKINGENGIAIMWGSANDVQYYLCTDLTFKETLGLAKTIK